MDTSYQLPVATTIVRIPEQEGEARMPLETLIFSHQQRVSPDADAARAPQGAGDHRAMPRPPVAMTEERMRQGAAAPQAGGTPL